MPIEIIVAGLVLVAGCAVWGLRRTRGATPAGGAQRCAPSVADTVVVQPAEPQQVGPLAVPELPAFRPVRVADVPAERQRALLATLSTLPRPSRLMQPLLSPSYVNEASARALADLIAGEPLLAARVIKAVNAPWLGLRQPVTGITQAVSYLGVTAVRITCLRYLFIASFKSEEPARQRAIARLWTVSALASELVQRACVALAVKDSGRWASAVLLSYLGRLAAVTQVPAPHLAALCDVSAAVRARLEQSELGLCASELGRLLMTDWGLPEAVVNDAADLGCLVFDAMEWPGDARGEPLALGALCGMLAERAEAASEADVPVPDTAGTEVALAEWLSVRARLGAVLGPAFDAWSASPDVLTLLRRASASQGVSQGGMN